MQLTAKDAKHAKSRTGTNPFSVRDSVRVVGVVRGSAGTGGKGGLLARSHAYQSGSGNFTNHNCYHADGNGSPREINAGTGCRRTPSERDPLLLLDTATLSHGEIITYLVNSSQGLAASYRYDPYGNTVSSSGSLASANVYRFSSKEFHLNSGLYYYGYRWYHPNLQRWPNRDPIQEEGGVNLFGFVLNGPINHLDPFGLTVPFVRECRGWEQTGCEAKCGADGVKSCTVTENYENEPGRPPRLVSTDINCTCNPPPESRWDTVCELFWLYVEAVGLRAGGGAIKNVEKKIIPIIIKPRPSPLPMPVPVPAPAP